MLMYVLFIEQAHFYACVEHNLAPSFLPTLGPKYHQRTVDRPSSCQWLLPATAMNWNFKKTYTVIPFSSSASAKFVTIWSKFVYTVLRMKRCKGVMLLRLLILWPKMRPKALGDLDITWKKITPNFFYL